MQHKERCAYERGELVEAERVLMVENRCWTLPRTRARVVSRVRQVSRNDRLEASITAISSRTGEVDLVSAKKLTLVGLKKLDAQIGDEILLKTTGFDAEEVLDLLETTVVTISERTRREFEETMRLARRHGDHKRAELFAAYIGLRKS